MDATILYMHYCIDYKLTTMYLCIIFHLVVAILKTCSSGQTGAVCGGRAGDRMNLLVRAKNRVSFRFERRENRIHGARLALCAVLRSEWELPPAFGKVSGSGNYSGGGGFVHSRGSLPFNLSKLWNSRVSPPLRRPFVCVCASHAAAAPSSLHPFLRPRHGW